MSYSRTRCSSLSLLEEIHVLHNASLPWMLMSFSSHFRGYDLNSVGYCLFGCDVMRSVGNLQKCWRKAHNFLAQLQHTFWVTTGWDEILKLCLIRPISKYKDDGTIHTVAQSIHYFFHSVVYFSFRFYFFLFYKTNPRAQIRQKGMLFYIYFLWVNDRYLSRSIDEDSGEREHTPKHKIVT
jgi:hypothetical protein